MRNPKVFFDVSSGDATAGRIEMELRADVVPVTAENFRSLCTGEKGMGVSGKRLHFKGSVFHDIDGLWGLLTGGDITHGNGSGGESIYGIGFPDENWDLLHNGPGILSMAKVQSYGNGSQFYLSTMEAPVVDGYSVVFGQVTRGMDVVFSILKVGMTDGKPNKAVVISDCGELV